ncbi:acyl-CoA thioesterase II [uncultured Georgenia sp.]|uniref:acyl-CoA thioesterase n=1 Tax=uncultured Georgenia sp. TaxID=378209 RepID=UPI00262E4DB4|nr:acyl-CoA thioesterase II [uncultured Georgenia sp.]HLV03425.1 acyl-CoA thioesterase II [Actinomycetaceae bacterium]
MTSTLPDAGEPTEALLSTISLLELERTGHDTCTGRSHDHPNGRVYGGQVLAQAIVAAAQTVADAGLPAPRLPHSVHGYFLRPGRLDQPITFEVERMRDGGSFSARRTHAIQDGKPILSMITSFQEVQEGLEHAQRPPQVPGPEELESSADIFARYDHPAAEFYARNGAFDIRHVEGAIYVPLGRSPLSRQALWMRSRGRVDGDQLLHRALLAYACDQVMLEPVLRRHELGWTSPGLSVASLDHAMWWHRDVRVDDWLLYVQDAPSAQGGRGLGIAKVYNTSGELVATLAQEGMVRVHTDT